MSVSNNKTCYVLLLVSLITMPLSTTEEFYKELILTSGYSDLDGWIGSNKMNLKNSVGFEYLKVF